MNGWTLTRVWQIDHKLVVAPTIEEAIEVFKVYMGKDLFHDIEHIQAIKSDNAVHDTEALIKEERIIMPPEPSPMPTDNKPIDIMDIVPAPNTATVNWTHEDSVTLQGKRYG